MSEDLKPSLCRGPNCRREIWWLINPTTGNLHPYDDPDGDTSHFISCPNAKDFRRKANKEAKK